MLKGVSQDFSLGEETTGLGYKGARIEAPREWNEGRVVLLPTRVGSEEEAVLPPPLEYFEFYIKC